MNRPAVLAVLLFLAPLAGVTVGQSEFGVSKPSAAVSSATESSATEETEQFTPLYDEELRRFVFRCEGEVATFESAEAFVVRYSSPENPPILGALPHPTQNALVVIGPPEAEKAIRATIARSLIEVGGLGTSLELERRTLLADWRSRVTDVAAIELALVAVDAEDDSDPQVKNKRADLVERIAAFEREIDVLEKQIAVIDRNLARLEKGPSRE